MRITHDPEADAMMIFLNERPATDHKMVNHNILLRLDDKGYLISIELLNVSKFVDEPDKFDFKRLLREVSETQK